MNTSAKYLFSAKFDQFEMQNRIVYQDEVVKKTKNALLECKLACQFYMDCEAVAAADIKMNSKCYFLKKKRTIIPNRFRKPLFKNRMIVFHRVRSR